MMDLVRCRQAEIMELKEVSHQICAGCNRIIIRPNMWKGTWATGCIGVKQAKDCFLGCEFALCQNLGKLSPSCRTFRPWTSTLGCMGNNKKTSQ